MAFKRLKTRANKVRPRKEGLWRKFGNFKREDLRLFQVRKEGTPFY